jgi:hypothetical protein
VAVAFDDDIILFARTTAVLLGALGLTEDLSGLLKGVG